MARESLTIELLDQGFHVVRFPVAGRSNNSCAPLPGNPYRGQSSQVAALASPNFTRVLIVTLPEATPVHEAAVLLRNLRRAEIEP